MFVHVAQSGNKMTPELPVLLQKRLREHICDFSMCQSGCLCLCFLLSLSYHLCDLLTDLPYFPWFKDGKHRKFKLLPPSFTEVMWCCEGPRDSPQWCKEDIFLDWFYEFQMLHPSGGWLMMIISLMSRLIWRPDGALSWRGLDMSQFLKACHWIPQYYFQIKAQM